jgi:hypothetical protein
VSRVVPAILGLLLFAPALRADGDPNAVSFEKDVYPVLKARCFSCHDARKQKAGLRLDVRSKALAGGESGKKGIVPGKPGASELLRRVTSTNDDEVMPPDGDRLTAVQAAKLRAWIAAGARWPDALASEPASAKHWAFVPPSRPPVPPGTPHPIDAFVRARLTKEGLAPAPEADRVTLIRRLSLDLIGLPPSPREVDEFVADRSPDAYAKLVEKLLASPHYGERWGRLWLDAARYADSDGFEKDKPRQVWFYRDWVINALNRDLPYDRFVIEQVAGDLLPDATQDQQVATGYLRNAMVNEEGGIDPEQFRMEAMFDRMDAIGKGVLGLTIQCAQCHSHKFDPITQAEYYRLFAFLNNAHEGITAVYTPAEQAKRAEVLRKVREIEDDLKHRHPDWQERLHAWADSVRGNQPAWRVVRPELDASGGQKHYLLPDGSVLAAGWAPSKLVSDFTAPAGDGPITGVRLEVMNDPSLPRGGPGRAPDGLFALTEFQVSAAPADQPAKTTKVKLVRATADASPTERPLAAQYFDKTKRKRLTGPVAFAIDGKDETAWTTDVGPGRSNVPRKAVFIFEKPVSFPKGTLLTVKLTQNHGGWNSNDNQTNNLGRFRFSVTSAPDPVADPLPAAVREAVEKPRAERTAVDEATMFAHWRTTVSDWKAANDAIEAAWNEHPAGTTQLVLLERDEPRPTHVLKRGDFLKPAERVAPGVPAILHPMPEDAPANRLGLANWLVDRRSPTTARAFVNRVWQAYFGAGLVTTPEDLGSQGELPSHPELLDWLAVEFMEPSAPAGHEPQARPWSLKHLHRLIVTSSTYRQSSTVTPDRLQKDPRNRLLARGPRFRADAEVVRDVALAASGLLNRTVGGPSVYPPVPAFLMLPPASYGTKTWPEATGSDRYRRSLYVFRFRSVPYPPLAAFDAPNGDFACVARPRSNTPLQSLTVLNEPVFVEAARGLAARTLREGGDADADRLAYAFRLCVARRPTGPEAAVLTKLLEKQRSRFAAADAKPTEVLGDNKLFPNGTSPAEAAAWTAVARVLINLDETMTKE